MDWEEEYKTMVLNAEDYFDNVNKFIQPYIPQVLYKYSGCNSDYWKDRLLKGELYFCPSNKLNDKFDGTSRIDLKMALRKGTKLNKKFNTVNLNNRGIKEVLNGLKEDICIASLSEIYNSTSMWDRYADRHTGFCIAYDTGKMSEFKKSLLFKVIYGEKPDITKQVENLYNGAGLASIVFKADEWRNEQEWRMFKICKNQGNIKYYFRKEIKAVYLGMDCKEENKNIIINWAKQENKEVYQMISDDSTQQLFAKKII